jgi:hypothetical protein
MQPFDTHRYPQNGVTYWSSSLLTRRWWVWSLTTMRQLTERSET